MSQRLDRDRPLWEYWVIEGLTGDRWALLSKVHHCMMDGVTGNELYRLMGDTEPEPKPSAPDDWQPRSGTGSADLALDALGQLVRLPVEQLRLLTGAVRAPAVSTQRLRHAVRGLATLAAGFAPAAPTSLSGPLGTARRYAVARTSLTEMASIAKAGNVTVNDVYLAAVSGAFRRLMPARGEEPARDAVRTLVPVNVRKRTEQGVLDNRLASMLLLLPVDIADPAGRLAEVHRRVLELRSGHQVEGSTAVVALGDVGPYAAASLAIRAALRLPQRAVITVTTNVPGPREQ